MEGKLKDNGLSLHELRFRKDIQKLKRLLKKSIDFDIDEAIADKSTVLHLAVRKGDEKMIEILLRSGTDVKQKNKKGENPLHIAAEIGNSKLVKLFLEEGISINVITKDRLTPLHIAVKNNHINVLELLLRENARINTQNVAGDSPLHDAVRGGFISVVELLLRSGADPNCMNNEKASPFYESFAQCNVALTKLFLSYNVDVKLKNYSGENALHLAAKFSTEEIVELLLRMNLNPNDVASSGFTPLHYAVYNRNFSEQVALAVARTLTKHGADIERTSKDGNTAFFASVKNQNYKLIKYFLRLGANINCKNGLNETPLFTAIENADVRLIVYLIESGANLSTKNTRNESPLHAVIRAIDDENMRYVLVKLLIKHGANVNERDVEKATALHLAIEENDANLFELLVKSGACINLKDGHRLSPIFLGVTNNIVDVVKKLLDLGANVNDTDSNKRSLLEEAVGQRDEDMVELLLEYGANAKEGKIVLLAAEEGNLNVMMMLLAAGADINAVDDTGVSVLVAAIIKSQQAMVQHLLENGAEVNFEENGYTPLHHAYFTLYSNRNNSSRFTMYLVLKHIALLSVQGLFVHDLNMRFLRSKSTMSSRYESYCQELVKMKFTLVYSESPVTYFDVLVKRHNALVRCLRCVNVRTALLTGDYKKRFPKYFNRLEANYFRGWKRLQLIDQFQDFLNETLKFSLPSDVTYKISEYFSDGDLNLMLRSNCSRFG